MDRNQNIGMRRRTADTPNDFERDHIRNVQQYLRHLSFHDDRINDLPTDGIWEDDTRQALIAFQRGHNIPATGVVDRATWDLLKAEYDKSVALNSPPTPLSLFPREPQEFEITLGNTGFLVNAIQFLLSELERLYYFPDYTPSGVYDEATATLVRDFQARNKIPVTGTVGRETWDAMAIQHNLLLRADE